MWIYTLFLKTIFNPKPLELGHLGREDILWLLTKPLRKWIPILHNKMQILKSSMKVQNLSQLFNKTWFVFGLLLEFQHTYADKDSRWFTVSRNN